MNIYNKVVEVVTFNIAIEYIKLVYHKKDFIPHIKFGKILKLFIDACYINETYVDNYTCIT